MPSFFHGCSVNVEARDLGICFNKKIFGIENYSSVASASANASDLIFKLRYHTLSP